MDFQASIFTRKSANILPSPPVSPSIYAYPPAFEKHGCCSTRLASCHILPAPSESANGSPEKSAQQARDKKASASQSQENPPCDRLTPPHSSSLHQMAIVDNPASVSSDLTFPKLAPPDQISSHLQRDETLKQRPMRVSSTSSHPPPQVVLTEAEHQSDPDELYTGSEDEEEVAINAEPAKSSAERLAEKRKMKRFRLTHAQTRYLMSEFSRQPHPDAAQRERLSRDVPGLNPRQVQVWFQNRRAKLKRLTTEDQERMRSSRTLPEDFDFSQTLRPILRDARPLYGPALTEPLMLGGNTNQRPNLRLGMGHLSMASNGINSSFTNHFPSPISATGSANPSPVSSVNEGPGGTGLRFSATQSPSVTSPRFTNPFGHPPGLSAGSTAFPGQGRHSSQSSIMRLSGQPLATTSPLSPFLANDTYGFGCLPPLQFARAPSQTRDDQSFSRFQIAEEPSHESGIGIKQHYISPLSSPSTLPYDQSHMLYPSCSGFRTSSSYQSSDTSFWQGSQMSSQENQYGQQMQPHQTTEQRHGNEPSRTLPHDPSVNRHDQRSYSLSGEHYRRMSSSTNHQQPQSMMLGAEIATARPRARSDTYPAYYGTHSQSTS